MIRRRTVGRHRPAQRPRPRRDRGRDQRGLVRGALTVKPTAGAGLAGPVEFHLNPTFPEAVKIVEPTNGLAELRLKAWGSFTVGVVTDKESAHGRGGARTRRSPLLVPPRAAGGLA